MEPGERKVEAQDDATKATQFPRKKERKERRKHIVDTIKKYSIVDSLRQKVTRLKKDAEEAKKEMEQTQHIKTVEEYTELERKWRDIKEEIKEATDNLNELVDPNSEDPDIKKPRFFFLRDDNNRPVVCICDIIYFGATYRGISICSPLEHVSQFPGGKQKFCKATGRKIAFDRAIAAIMAGMSCMPVKRTEARQVLASVGVPWVKREEPIFKAQVGTGEIDKEIAAAYKPRK